MILHKGSPDFEIRKCFLDLQFSTCSYCTICYAFLYMLSVVLKCKTLEMDESPFLTLPCKVLTACLSVLPNNILPLIAGHLPEVNCMKGLLEMRLNGPPQSATVCQLCLTSSDCFTVFWKMKKNLKGQKACIK